MSTVPFTDSLAPTPPKRSRFRRWLFWLYFLGIHAVLAAAIYSPESVERFRKFLFKTPYSEGEYRGMALAHGIQSASLWEGSAVFLGDSILRGLNLRDVLDSPAYNFSIGGDTTIGLLWRLPKYRNLDKTKFVALAIGINDLSHITDEAMLANYEKILLELDRQGVKKIVAFSILPIDERTYSQANSSIFHGQSVDNAKISRMNARLAELCSKFKNVTFADLSSSMKDETGNLATSHTWDGLHLTAQGYTVWAKAMHEYFTGK